MALSVSGSSCNTEPFADFLLTCSICYDHFNTPKVLPCLHSFCQTCIERHFSVYQLRNRGHLSCPNCREIIPLPVTGVGGFKNDLVVGRVADIIARLKKMAKDEEVMCGDEDDALMQDEAAAMLEEDDSCAAIAKKKTYFPVDNDGVSSAKRKVLKGFVDRMQTIIAFNRCKILQLYRIENHVKWGIAAEIGDGMARVDGRSKKKHLNAEKRAAATEEKRKIACDIEERHAHVIAQLEREQDRVYKKIVDIKSVHDVVEETIEKYTSSQIKLVCEFLLDVITGLCLDKEVCNKSNLLEGLQLPGDLVNIVNMEMNNNKEFALARPALAQEAQIMGLRLLFRLGGSSKKSASFNYPTHATFMPDGNILLSDKNNSRLQIYNLQGQLQGEMLRGRVKPRRARINKMDGLLYICDETLETVKVYTPDGRTFLRTIGDRFFQCVAGMDFDAKGNLVMSDPEKGYITIHRPNGQMLSRWFFRQMSDKFVPNPYYIYINEDDQLLVSDNRNNCVKVFSSTGQFLFKIAKLDCPRGVCTDPYGNILIAEGDRHCVSMYSPYGKFMQYLIHFGEFGVKYPLSIEMDADGHLALTQCSYCGKHELLLFELC